MQRQGLGAPVAVLGKIRIDVVRVGLVDGALVGALVRRRIQRWRRRGSDNKLNNIVEDHSPMPDPRSKKEPEVGVTERKTRNLVPQSRNIMG